MHTLKLLFTYYILIFFWIIIFSVQTNFLFSFIIIAIINRLFFHLLIIILDDNMISYEGAKWIAKALKLNKNLTRLHLSIFLLLYSKIIIISE